MADEQGDSRIDIEALEKLDKELGGVKLDKKGLKKMLTAEVNRSEPSQRLSDDEKKQDC